MVYGTTSETTMDLPEAIRRDTGPNPRTGIPQHVDRRSKSHDEPGTRETDLGKAVFSAELEGYLRARGNDRKNRRNRVVEHITQSRYSKDRVAQVLDAIRVRATEDRMEAAIDLLAITGKIVRQIATEDAFASCDEGPVGIPFDGDAAYVLAVAAGRASPELIGDVLVHATSAAMREAAAELTDRLPPDRARSILTRLAESDEDETVRRVAKEVLGELD
jgi:hypothetical protein